MLAKQELCLFS